LMTNFFGRDLAAALWGSRPSSTDEGKDAQERPISLARCPPPSPQEFDLGRPPANGCDSILAREFICFITPCRGLKNGALMSSSVTTIRTQGSLSSGEIHPPEQVAPAFSLGPWPGSLGPITP